MMKWMIKAYEALLRNGNPSQCWMYRNQFIALLLYLLSIKRNNGFRFDCELRQMFVILYIQSDLLFDSNLYSLYKIIDAQWWTMNDERVKFEASFPFLSSSLPWFDNHIKISKNIFNSQEFIYFSCQCEVLTAGENHIKNVRIAEKKVF